MRRNAITGIVIVAIVALVAVVLIVDRPDSTGASAASGGSGDGSPATLTGQTTDGAAFDLADYRGKPVVLNFYASWCGPCNAEAPDLAAFARENPDVTLIGIDTGDKLDEGKAFAEKYGLDYTMVFDPNGAIANDWGVDGIPTTVFLDAGGVERDRIVGAADKSAFESALQSAQ